MSVFYVGLDLGQAQDFTGLAIVERIAAPAGGREAVHHVRHLERFPLRTPYTAVVTGVSRLLSAPPLRGACRLVVDATGVGAAVVDLLAAARLAPVPVTITGGDVASRDDRGGWRVPKRDLVAVLLVLLQGGRLKIARELPEAETLQRELLGFQVKITASAHDTYGAWREGAHDDLVLAVALACWYCETHPPPCPAGVAASGTRWSGRALADIV